MYKISRHQNTSWRVNSKPIFEVFLSVTSPFSMPYHWNIKKYRTWQWALSWWSRITRDIQVPKAKPTAVFHLQSLWVNWAVTVKLVILLFRLPAVVCWAGSHSTEALSVHCPKGSYVSSTTVWKSIGNLLKHMPWELLSGFIFRPWFLLLPQQELGNQ